jgi:hypothetical protein
MEYLGLHNKPKAAVHPELLPTGPLKKKKKMASQDGGCNRLRLFLVNSNGKSLIRAKRDGKIY